MKNRIVHAVVVAALVLGMWWFSRRQRTSVEERVRSMESGAPVFVASEFKSCLQQAREAWDAAMRAVAGGDLAAAGLAYADVHYAGIKTYAEQHGRQEAEPGVPVSSWQAGREEAFRAAVMKALPGWFEAVATGDLAVEVCREFTGTADQFGFKAPQEQFKAAERALEARRARAASRWLRVEMIADHPEYAAQIEKALRAKWETRPGFKLTFGHSMGPLENQSTWKTLRVQVTQDSAHYEVLNKRAWGRVTPPTIPRGARITFVSEGSPEVPTSWNRLEPLSASVTVPERLTVNENDPRDRERFLELAREKRKEILAQLEGPLAGLPAFAPFPGVNAATLSIRKGDRIDVEAARALGYLDKPRLLEQAQALARDPRLQGELAGLVVGLELDALAPWLTQAIPQMSPPARRGLVQELKRRPWFGEHDPLVALVRAEGREPTYLDFDCLRGQLQVAKVREAVVEQVNRPTPARQNFAQLCIAELPLDDACRQVTAWMADTNADFVRAVLMQLGNRDREAASRVAVAGFSRAPESLKPILFDQIARGTTRADTAILGLARRSLGSRDDALRASVVRFLLEHSHEPAGWEMLDETVRLEPPGRRAEECWQRLALNARRAQPERAQEFLLSLVRAQTNHVREIALLELVGMDSPKPDLFPTLVRLTEERPQDANLRQTLVRAVHQHHRLRQGWTYPADQTGLSALLIAGLRDGDAQTRRRCEEVMRYAVQKHGARHFESYVSAASAAAGAMPVQAREPGGRQP